MKKLLFALIITILFTGLTVFGQNQPNEILAAGAQPLTRQMVTDVRELFEWVLDGQMTKQEQTEFERQRVAEWQANDEKNMESFNSLLAMREKVLALNEETRAQLKQKFQPAFLRNIRQTPNDPMSKILISVYTRSHSGLNSNTGVISSGAINENSNAGINSAIIGEWAQSDTSTLGFTNSSGGTNSAGSNQVGMRFEPDGTFKSAYYVQSSMYGCTVTAFGYKTGTYHVIGATVYLDEKTYSLSSKDSCNASRNSEKNPPLSHIKYAFRLVRDAEGEKLALQTKSGDDVFYRNTGKSMLDH